MNLYKRRNHVFGRIGDRYSTFIDPDHFMGRTAFEDSWIAKPDINILKDKNHFEMEVGLPGYSKKDIKISVDGHVLSVVAEKKSTGKTEQNQNYIQKEIDTDRMERTFYLSSLIDTEKIASQFENGLLQISLPFVSKSKSRAISIS